MARLVHELFFRLGGDREQRQLSAGGTERSRSNRLGPGASLRMGHVQSEMQRRNFKRFIGILLRSRISGTDTVEVAKVADVCATSISGSAVSSTSSVSLAKSIDGILRSTSWVCDGNATSHTCYKRSGG
jgi:hypothetical protein